MALLLYNNCDVDARTLTLFSCSQVAIFIVQRILLDDMGLAYICQTYERFYAVGTVLSNMVHQLVDTLAVRLLKHVVKCYLRLSDNPRYHIGSSGAICVIAFESAIGILNCHSMLLGLVRLCASACPNL